MGAADRLLASAVRPSKKLLEHAAEEIKNREQFVLLADQRLAYELVPHAVGKAHREDVKVAVIVTGGPGRGESVIARSLLGELSRQNRSILHATGPKSVTRHLLRRSDAASAR